MNFFKFKLCLTSCMIFFTLLSFGQRSISGVVTDEKSGEALIGVNVVVLGTSFGTTTDIDGKYSLSIKEDQNQLEFSYVGYEDLIIELKAYKSNTINLTLKEGSILDEVVVIGYGTAKRRNVAGAVSTVQSKDFNKGVITSPEQLIQGKVAGVQIASNSGEPGGGMNVRIRGTSSIRNGNGPLYVVDGIPLDGGNVSASGRNGQFGASSARNPLNFLNPNDIQSLDILKDPTTTAIYGSRGANGVVLISTKSGKFNTGLNYTFDVGFSNITKKYNVLSGEEYRNQLGANILTPDTAFVYNVLDSTLLNTIPFPTMSNVNWQDEIFETGISTNHAVSFGGGNNDSEYRVSLGLTDQNGIVKKSSFQRISINAGGSKKFFDKRLKVGANVNVASIYNQYPLITDNAGFEGDLLAAALKSNPTAFIYQQNYVSEYADGAGNIYQDEDGFIVKSLEETIDSSDNNIDTLYNIEYEIFPNGDPIPILGEDGNPIPVTDSDGNPIPKQLSVSEPNPIALLQYSNDRASTLRALARISADLSLMDGLTWKNIIGLDKSISKRNAAFSKNIVAQGIQGSGRLYVSDLQRDNRSWTSYLDYGKKFGEIDFNGLLGYEYQKFDRSESYILMSDFATDDLNLMVNNLSYASSAISINSINQIDELQSVFLRANLGFNNKLYVNASVRTDGSTKFGENNRYGIFPAISAKYIIQEGEGSINNLSVRAGFGLTGNQEIPHNLFQARDRNGDNNFPDAGGVELGGVASVTFANPNLQWESTQQLGAGIDFGFLDYKLSGSIDVYRKNTNNLLIKVEAAQPAPQPFSWENIDGDVINKGIELALDYLVSQNSNFSWDVGVVLGYNDNQVKNLTNSYDTGGINGQGLTGAFAQRIANGQPLYAFFLREFGGYDEAGNTIYTGGDVQKFVDASPLPKLNAGLTSTFRFADVDFSFFLNGLFGHHIYSNTENAFFTKGAFSNGRNVTLDTVNSDEGSLNAPDVSTRFLYKGDFARLQSASLGYNLPISSNYVSGIRLFVNGQNLFTITGYPFQDPEVNVNKAIDGIPSFGIDYTPYPRARTILVGASVNFK